MPILRRFLVAAVLCLLALSSGVFARAAQPANLQPGEFAPDRIIVKYKASASSLSVGAAQPQAKAPSIAALHARHGVVADRQLFPAQAEAAIMSLDTVGLSRVHLLTVPVGADIAKVFADYAADPNVEYAEPDWKRKAFFTPNDTYFATGQWNLKNTGQTGGIAGADISATAAWDITKGSFSVTIAVVDTGVQANHPDLIGKVVAGYDFVNLDADPSDDNGHGTHTAGIAGAYVNNGIGIAGVCPNCLIMPVKVLDYTGAGWSSDIASGIRYGVDHGARVINLSLGGSYSQLEHDAVIYAHNAGGVVTAPTGNDGIELIEYPAGYGESIAVGASDDTDARAWYSTYGKDIDVIAPGSNILSTVNDSWYAYMDGTSMAAPHVAGLAGLILSKNPGYTADQVKWHIEAGANSSAGWDIYHGFGRINAYNSLQTMQTGLIPSEESAYSLTYTKGLYPSSGDTSTDFVYKAVYFDDNNAAPASVQVCIDGACRNMSLDTASAATLHDGNYANGEQYVYTANLSTGNHNYYFSASNGTVARTMPTAGTMSGPNAVTVGPLSVKTAPLPSAEWNSAYSYTLSAKGGVKPYTWSVSAGTPPAGLSLDAATGVISGAPTVVGQSNFTIKARDANLMAAYASLSISIIDTIAPVVTATPDGGTFYAAQTVALTANEPAVIYYSTNDTTPSVAYASPITIGASATLKYFAVDASGNSSAIVAAAYTILTRDLTVSALCAPSKAALGAAMDIANTVSNAGTASTMGSYVKFYLSTDAVLDAADVYIGRRYVGAINSTTPSTAVTALTVPASTPVGNVYLIAQADATNTNEETDETNNTAYAAVTITDIDLVLSGVSGPASAARGGVLQVASTVTNQGSSASGISYVKFYLLSDAAADPATGVYIGFRRVEALAPNESSSATVRLWAPLTVQTGQYYVGAIADATLANAEGNEANNAAVSTAAATVTRNSDMVESGYVPAGAAYRSYQRRWWGR